MSNTTTVPNRIYLTPDELPQAWYNIQADLPNLQPSLNPQTLKPITAEDLAPLYPKDVVEQELSTERFIAIPEAVQEQYRSYRATPLIRAYRLEKELGTPAKIYYKYEGIAPSGSHKLNTAIPQAYYNKIAGIKRLATETGAGQWGTALSIACRMFDLACTVYMVKVSYQQKPYRKSIMETFGAEVFPSPTNLTESGRAVLAENPDYLGSLGLAISEAVEDAVTHDHTNYALGSVLNHVLLHQTIIGLEAKTQLEKVGEYPDMVIGCCGGGSNFGGIAFPFVKDKMDGKHDIDFLAVEPTACPTLTRGKFAYDYGDVGKLAPITPMYTLGHAFVPNGIHAGGLRYHGDSPLVSQLYKDGIIGAKAVTQPDVFAAAKLFAHCENILPAPESSHAILAAIDEAKACKETGEEKTILFCLSGHGHFDLTAYDAYNAGKIQDAALSQDALDAGLATIPKV